MIRHNQGLADNGFSIMNLGNLDRIRHDQGLADGGFSVTNLGNHFSIFPFLITGDRRPPRLPFRPQGPRRRATQWLELKVKKTKISSPSFPESGNSGLKIYKTLNLCVALKLWMVCVFEVMTISTITHQFYPSLLARVESFGFAWWR